MKYQKIVPVVCPYCAAYVYAMPEGGEDAKIDKEEELQCERCKRKFRPIDLPA